MTNQTVDLDPAFCHHVWVKVAGYMMSEEAQDQRDALAEWFLRSGIEEEDMDSAFVSNSGTKAHWKEAATHMVFGFRDPIKAMLFKLAWA